MAGARGQQAMTKAILKFEDASFVLDLSPLPDLSEDEFFRLCQRNEVLRLERTAAGEIVIMPPAGGGSSHRNIHLARALATWTEGDGGGAAFDATGGFRLPNGAVRAPDAAWVRRERLAVLSADQLEQFPPLCPDFVVEVRSRTDRAAELRAKMHEYIANGAQLGWFIDPYDRTAEIYRPGHEPEILVRPERLLGDPELPGFVLELDAIWRGLAPAHEPHDPSMSDCE